MGQVGEERHIATYLLSYFNERQIKLNVKGDFNEKVSPTLSLACDVLGNGIGNTASNFWRGETLKNRNESKTAKCHPF